MRQIILKIVCFYMYIVSSPRRLANNTRDPGEMTIVAFPHGILSLLALTTVLFLERVLCLSHLRTFNLDTTFSKWPDRNNVRYCIDSYYTTTEAQYIKDAAAAVTTNTNGCVKFVEISCTDTSLYKIRVSPYDENGVLQTFCFSYPGQHNGLINKGATEQRMIVTRGTYGCLDGVKRSLMRFFTIVLGKRNEHQRNDRDQYLTVALGNVGVANAYRLYNTSEAHWQSYPYDYCSITHNQPTDYAIPGAAAFSVINAPYTIPKLDQLSNTDCQIMSLIYQCPTACEPLDCTALQATAAAVCDPTIFCNTAPTESTYLIGPYQFYQTFLLFTGGCVMEYTYDYLTGKLFRNVDSSTGQQIAPQATNTYFKAPGGPTFTPPIVDLAYMTYDPSTGGNTFQINIDNRQTSKQLTCSSNGAFNSGALALTCPSAASTSGATVPLSQATSASTQQYLLNSPPDLYQYVVLPGNTEIGLMDATFTTLYDQTTNFLAGQSTITKITAIQIMQDERDPQQTVRFGIFGTGADGVTPYFGFVNMLVSAAPFLDLDDPAVLPNPNPGERWVEEPKSLRTVLQGCT